MFRLLAFAVFFASLSISMQRRWRARRAGGTIPRRQEPPGLIAGRVLVALPLFGGVVAYVMNPSWMAWASIGIPSWARWMGVGLGTVVVPSVNWVLTTLGQRDRAYEAAASTRHDRSLSLGAASAIHGGDRPFCESGSHGGQLVHFALDGGRPD